MGPPATDEGDGYEVVLANLKVRKFRQGSVHAGAVFVEHLDGARELGIAANVAHIFESAKLMGDRRERRKTHHIANLAHGRRIALLFNLGADRVKNLLLARGQRRAGCCCHISSFGLCRRRLLYLRWSTDGLSTCSSYGDVYRTA